MDDLDDLAAALESLDDTVTTLAGEVAQHADELRAVVALLVEIRGLLVGKPRRHKRRRAKKRL
jgi:hypothetical protein